MHFYRRATARPKNLGVLAGSFNPPTVAHLALAEAAGSWVDELLWVAPGAFPHKHYFGATLEQRLEMLGAMQLTGSSSIATTEAGLFVDIARECGAEYDPDVRLYFLCGRDAAERVLTWDYGRPGVVEEMLREFELLVAARGGRFHPPAALHARIHALAISGEHDSVSSTEVRERIARGRPWEHLVPESIVERVREIYS